MKATRRQELKTNELAQYLTELREWLGRYGNYVAIVIIAIAAVVLISFYMKRSASEALATATKEMSSLQFDSDDAAKASITKLQDISQGVGNQAVAVDALRMRAEIAMTRAHAATDGTPSAEFLDLAETAYQELVDRHTSRPLDVGLAWHGLATIEADRFVLDNDAAHQETARTYLERVRDHAELNGTPVQALALTRLNELDSIFVMVEIAEPLPAPPPTAEDEPKVSVQSGGGDTIQLMPIEDPTKPQAIETRRVPAAEVPEDIRQKVREQLRQGGGVVPLPVDPTATESPEEEAPEGSDEPAAAEEPAASSSEPSSEPPGGSSE